MICKVANLDIENFNHRAVAQCLTLFAITVFVELITNFLHPISGDDYIARLVLIGIFVPTVTAAATVAQNEWGSDELFDIGDLAMFIPILIVSMIGAVMEMEIGLWFLALGVYYFALPWTMYRLNRFLTRRRIEYQWFPYSEFHQEIVTFILRAVIGAITLIAVGFLAYEVISDLRTAVESMGPFKRVLGLLILIPFVLVIIAGLALGSTQDYGIFWSFVQVAFVVAFLANLLAMNPEIIRIFTSPDLLLGGG